MLGALHAGQCLLVFEIFPYILTMFEDVAYGYMHTFNVLIFSFIDIGRVSPIQRPATIHSPPTQLINLGQVPTVQHDVEIDFAAHNTPLTPSHMHHVTPTHTPSPCNTPSHLSHKFGPSSPISKPVKNNCTSEYGSPEAERDLGQASDSPMVTTPPDTCCMCGQQYPANTLEANSVMLSVNSTQSLPVNASSLRNQMERFCQSEQAQYTDAEVRHLDELKNGSPMEESPSESPSELEFCECVCVYVCVCVCVCVCV